MFRSSFWWRLVNPISWVLLLIMSLPLTMFPRTAFAQTSQNTKQSISLVPFPVLSRTLHTQTATVLTIQRIWTRDGKGKDKPSFNPGDAIQYTAYINNSSSQPVTMKITFDATGPIGPNAKDIYLYTQNNVKVPPGLSGWYSPSIVPTSAPGGTYAVGIAVSDSSDGAFDQADVFTIAPVGRMVIPSKGTVTQLFLDNCSQCTHETWYPSYYDQQNTLQARPLGGVHSGVDISNGVQDCSSSTPVYAAGEGMVIWAGWAGPGFGWSVVVKHGYGFNGNHHYAYTLYGHMGTVGTDPQTSKSCLQTFVGSSAYPSLLLGYQGSSGLSSEVTHVHFMFFVGDQNVTQLSKPYDLVNNYSTYPASPDFYTCMELTSGDPTPLGYVNNGDNKC